MSWDDGKSIVCYFDGQFLHVLVFIFATYTYYDFGDSNEQAQYKCQLFECFICFLTVIWWISDAFQHITFNTFFEMTKKAKRSKKKQMKTLKISSWKYFVCWQCNYGRHFSRYFLKMLIKLTTTNFALSHTDSIIQSELSNRWEWAFKLFILDSVHWCFTADFSSNMRLSKHLYKYCSFRWWFDDEKL